MTQDVSLELVYAGARGRNPHKYLEVAGMTLPRDFDERLHAGQLGYTLLRIGMGPVWRYQTKACCDELVLVEIHPALHLAGKGHATVHGLNAAAVATDLCRAFGGHIYLDGKRVGGP